jgi:hypothetical protein
MTSHHHIPLFLLNRWATGERLFSYHWSHDKAEMLENRRTSVQSACRLSDSDLIHRVSASSEDAPDQDLFALHVDGPAASVLDTMFRHGVLSLTADERSAWAHLIVSLGARTPEAFRLFEAADDRDAKQMTAAGYGDPSLGAQPVATALLERDRPLAERNVSIKRAMELAADPTRISKVAAMEWWLRRFEGRTILFSDRPLLAQPRIAQPCGVTLHDPSCLIILPVAPDTVFFATADPKVRAKVRKTPKGKLVNAINEEIVWRAARYVYAQDGSLTAFIHDRLAGKAKGRWRPR